MQLNSDTSNECVLKERVNTAMCHTASLGRAHGADDGHQAAALFGMAMEPLGAEPCWRTVSLGAGSEF